MCYVSIIRFFQNLINLQQCTEGWTMEAMLIITWAASMGR